VKIVAHPVLDACIARHNLHRTSYVESSDKLQIYGSGDTAARITENVLV